MKWREFDNDPPKKDGVYLIYGREYLEAIKYQAERNNSFIFYKHFSFEGRHNYPELKKSVQYWRKLTEKEMQEVIASEI